MQEADQKTAWMIANLQQKIARGNPGCHQKGDFFSAENATSIRRLWQDGN